MIRLVPMARAIARHLCGFTMIASFAACISAAPEYGWRFGAACFGVFWLAMVVLPARPEEREAFRAAVAKRRAESPQPPTPSSR